jgi:hypothetical protein
MRRHRLGDGEDRAPVRPSARRARRIGPAGYARGGTDPVAVGEKRIPEAMTVTARTANLVSSHRPFGEEVP